MYVALCKGGKTGEAFCKSTWLHGPESECLISHPWRMLPEHDGGLQQKLQTRKEASICADSGYQRSAAQAASLFHFAAASS